MLWQAWKEHNPGHPTNHFSRASTSLDVVGNAIAILEDDANLNAGYGSNLTLNGTVECDAAIMDGHLNYGSVGAVSGIKNPIRLAHAVLDYAKVPDLLGRIPPLTLVSEGAYSFAIDKCTKHASQNPIDIVAKGSLISPKAREQWTKWKTRLDNISSTDINDPTGLTDIQDTVGAIAYQKGDTIAAGVSRLMLSQAAIFGAGCWAQEFSKSGIKLACSAGEYITKSMLAREIANAFAAAIAQGGDIDCHEILHDVVLEKFWSQYLIMKFALLLDSDVHVKSPVGNVVLYKVNKRV
ncbi:hypothetical protein H0H93_008423 [Arthromyces matolae]|nr:hypothetical protein H0H93_008423 [Arthromyces matolae]